MGVTQSCTKPTSRERADKEQYQFELCKVGKWKKENAKVKAIKYKGKCNTHFLHPGFLRRSKTKVVNMNVKDGEDPTAPRTSDNEVIVSMIPTSIWPRLGMHIHAPNTISLTNKNIDEDLG
jgi:hypothetical protein